MSAGRGGPAPVAVVSTPRKRDAFDARLLAMAATGALRPGSQAWHLEQPAPIWPPRGAKRLRGGSSARSGRCSAHCPRPDRRKAKPPAFDIARSLTPRVTRRPTVPANATIARVTDRMPAMLKPSDWSVWLGETDAPLAEVKALLQSHDDGGGWNFAPQPSPSKKPTKATEKPDLFS